MDEGFSVFHDVFERHDVGRAGDELERALTARSKAGARHVLSVPVVRALATAPALLRIAGGFVASTASNGSLRVLPGTHRRGVLSDGDIQTLTRQVPAVKCLADAGGVVAMRPLIVHASSKATGSARRRVVHIEYVDDVRLAPGVELATTV